MHMRSPIRIRDVCFNLRKNRLGYVYHLISIAHLVFYIEISRYELVSVRAQVGLP